MRIAVGITIRNDREGLVRLLEALARQTRAPDALLVVDAASTDGTDDVAHEFAKRAPFPVTVESEPCKRGAGRARILKLADTDLVAFTDGDCEPPSTWLADLEAAWGRTRAELPRLAAIGGPSRAAPGGNALQHAIDDVMERMEAASFDGVNTCNALYARDAALAVGNFDATLQVAEDPDLNARLARAGHALRRVDVPMLQRRRATWGDLARQHFAYGKGARTLLARYPERFPVLEHLMAPAVGVTTLVALLLALVASPAWLLLALAPHALPFVVHRRHVAAFLRAHGLSGAFWRRVGVLWVVFVPYQAGALLASMRWRS